MLTILSLSIFIKYTVYRVTLITQKYFYAVKLFARYLVVKLACVNAA